MRNGARVILASMLLATVGATGSWAQGARFGVRGGLSFSPDQFVLGAQAEVGRWAFARIVPSVDVGFGDDVTTIAFNGDFLLKVELPDAKLELYGGAGPTAVYADVSNGPSDWNVGLSLVVGGRLPIGGRHAVNLEGRFGVGDIPDFKLIAAIIL